MAGVSNAVGRTWASVGRTWATVWYDPFFGGGLRFGLATIWVLASLALAVNIFLWIFKLFGIVPLP